MIDNDQKTLKKRLQNTPKIRFSPTTEIAPVRFTRLQNV